MQLIDYFSILIDFECAVAITVLELLCSVFFMEKVHKRIGQIFFVYAIINLSGNYLLWSIDSLLTGLLVVQVVVFFSFYNGIKKSLQQDESKNS